MPEPDSLPTGLPEAETWRGAREIDRILGALTLGLLRDWHGWVHRRVESVSLEDPVTFIRRVSIDFTLYRTLAATTFTAEGAPIFFVPLALVSKDPLTRLDVHDERGTRLPVLTKRRNGVLAASVLVALVEGAVGHDFLTGHGGTVPRDIELDLADVATGSEEAARAVVNRLRSGDARPDGDAYPYSSDWRSELKNADEEIWEVVDWLAEGFILATPLAGLPGNRRILKYSYEEQGSPPRLILPAPLNWLQRAWFKQVAREEPHAVASCEETTSLPLWLARAVGWRAKSVRIATPSLGRGGSYHLEIEVPEGLRITQARLDGPSGATLAHVERSLRRVHLYPVNRPVDVIEGRAVINIRPETSTIVRTAWLTAGFATLVLALIAIRWREIVENEAVGPALSLLLILPAGLAAYVARAREPAVVTDALFGMRLLAVAPAVWLFASGVLMLAGRSCVTEPAQRSERLCESWAATGSLLWALVGASLATFWILTVTLTLIARPPEQRMSSSNASAAG